MWFNTGDCAHEAHVRQLVAAGSHLAYSREKGAVLVPGSKFIDGIGSTEMGHSAIPRHAHLDEQPVRALRRQAVRLRGDRAFRPRRRHGGTRRARSATWAEVADPGPRLLERLGGHLPHPVPRLLPDRRPDVPRRRRLLLPRRPAVDAVDLGDGNWLYTAMSEERILARCPDVRDCTVVAGRMDAAVVTDVFLLLAPGADAGADRGAAVREALGGPRRPRCGGS